jgi:hypothetical protein
MSQHLEISTPKLCYSQSTKSELIESSSPLVPEFSTRLTIDAPYEQIEEGQAWWKSLDTVLDESSLRKIGRDNAIKLLNLPLK